jgi:hypothetical protein
LWAERIRGGRWSTTQIALAAGVVLVVVGLSVGLPLGLRSSSHHAAAASSGSTARTGNLSHAAYAKLYHSAVLGHTTSAVLKEWPSPPYQRYHSGSGLVCFEWWDKPVALYNLCFNSKGVLEDKAIE